MRIHRSVIALSVTLLLCNSKLLFAQYKYTPPEKLNDGIRVGTLKDAGFDETKIVAATGEILKGTYPNIHSLLIFRRGRLVYENYFTGEDRERGVGAIGVVTHTRETLHDMRSVTKSVVALALLHAVTTGKIKSLDELVFDIFPEYRSHADGDKKNITIRHLLTMGSGLEWDEEISYGDPRNSENQMDDAADPVEYVLQQKLVAKPGAVWNYSGGSTHLLAEIVKRKTGMRIDDYTAKYIFASLGISTFKWAKMRKEGPPAAASGLRLRSRDMAKIGLLVMGGGKWNGKQLISAPLIADVTAKHFSLEVTHETLNSAGYGYQVWLNGYRFSKQPVIYFSGNGGQALSIDREHDIMTVVTAGNYNQRGFKHASWEIYPDLVFPAIIKGKAKVVR